MILPFQGVKPTIDKSVFVAPSADIIGDVVIGEHSSIWFNVVIRGDVHFIRIGKNTSIQDLTCIHVNHYNKPDRSDGSPTIIGDNVTIAHKVMLHGCRVENTCLIGMSATILDDAIIGEESIVGANSLVTKGKVFPPRSLILGNPAKVVRELTQKEVESLYQSAQNYLKYKNAYM